MSRIQCPLCGKPVPSLGDCGAAYRSKWYLNGLSDDLATLYRHLNDTKLCDARSPICPTCGKDFETGKIDDFPWRRFAQHWIEYGHMSHEEHVIAMLMAGEKI